MAFIDRRSLELLMIGLNADGEIDDGIGGITRLQKFIYLLEKEGKLVPSDEGFEFSAYKAGPYSSKLYDDLEFLENLGLIVGKVVAETTEEEAVEVDLLDYEELMGDGAEVSSSGSFDGFGASDGYEEKFFMLTINGKKRIEEIINNSSYKPCIDNIRKIKSKFGKYSLKDLLNYVYTKYPEMTTESEIKEKVLARKS